MKKSEIDTTARQTKRIREQQVFYDLTNAPLYEINNRVQKWALGNNIENYETVCLEFTYSMGYYNNPDLEIYFDAARPETDDELATRIALQEKIAARNKENATKSKLKTQETELKELARLKKKYEANKD